MQWNLIRLRKENGLTQADMAKLIDKTEETYRNKEKGVTQFSMDEMFIISNYFKQNIENIFLPSNFTYRELEEV